MSRLLSENSSNNREDRPNGSVMDEAVNNFLSYNHDSSNYFESVNDEPQINSGNFP
jgi:hypothetical protein